MEHVSVYGYLEDEEFLNGERKKVEDLDLEAKLKKISVNILIDNDQISTTDIVRLNVLGVHNFYELAYKLLSPNRLLDYEFMRCYNDRGAYYRIRDAFLEMLFPKYEHKF